MSYIIRFTGTDLAVKFAKCCMRHIYEAVADHEATQFPSIAEAHARAAAYQMRPTTFKVTPLQPSKQKGDSK